MIVHDTSIWANTGAAPIQLLFGEQLYRCIIEAIRHGYIETEGFPRIAAIVVGHHLGEGKQENRTSEHGSNTLQATINAKKARRTVIPTMQCTWHMQQTLSTLHLNGYAMR